MIAFITIYFVCVCLLVHVSVHGTCVNIKGQLEGTDLSLQHVPSLIKLDHQAW